LPDTVSVLKIPHSSKPFKLHKLDKQLNNEILLTKDEALDLYSKMNVARRMETAISVLYKEKQVRGFCHLYSGQVKDKSFFTKIF